ncbi:acetolactate synthase small subunit [Flavobacterium sp. CFBP9031]|uniref:acetolactate synthase small subunit n=1 Tax=Flavobacterium sp. CFBP9031 TaxID=3096538 RepID=UPI002A6A28F0|nr:acetolactate synthase small subunit [Flavobacterium sp. CFBP9031]MDY0989529.1 acetolactate synthase small subunit [Flavobacterium sp. CFBP9031]
MKNEFTLTIYSEDQIRLIPKLSSMFLRKQIQILSLNISICEIENMYRHTIVVNESLDTVINLAAQIEKIIEVFKCYYSSNDEIVSKQMVLFKMATEVFLTNANMESLLRENDLKVSEIEREYVILQTVGTDKEMEQLTEKLKRFGLIEFIKSSRIALMKSSEGFCVEI